MRNLIFLLFLVPLQIYPQTASKPVPVTEDRVRVLINEQVQIIETRLADLQAKQLALYKQDFDQRASTVEQQLDSLFRLGAIIAVLLSAGILVALGWAIKYARSYAQKRIEQEVDFAIYKLDPRRWPIRIPRKNFEKEYQRLQAIKYRNLIPYDGLNSQNREGITVYYAASGEDLVQLRQFMIDERVDPLKCCFVIYYTGTTKLNTQTLAPFDNFVFANMPGTLSSQIFAASRNIIHND
jgi:hypothetical protein